MYGTAQVTDGGSVDAQAARSPPYARLAFWGGVVDGLLAYSNSAAARNACGDFSRRSFRRCRVRGRTEMIAAQEARLPE